ncbi:Hemoglobin subunit beta [Frankliniella fusca]|uniref:Hemoglobin subunit beta n=1 Tax=Frankliniella fusca TaxID=407009 RepID=A0AAE1H9A9_9NEOP|nr:Hemoglobin subunit beta [Frankliniella fusca]
MNALTDLVLAQPRAQPTVSATNQQPLLKTITQNASPPPRHFIVIQKKSFLASNVNNKNLQVKIQTKPTESHSSILGENATNVIHPAPFKRQPLQQINLNQLSVAQTQVAAKSTFKQDYTVSQVAAKSTFEQDYKLSIPKPLKRGATILSESGSHITIPPAPFKRQALQQIPTTQLPATQVKQAPALYNFSNTIDNDMVSFSPVRLYTPAVKNFHEAKNIVEASDFSPVTNEQLLKSALVRKTKLSLSKKNSNSQANTPTSPASDNQDESKLPGQKSLEEIIQEFLPANFDHKIESLEPLKPYHKNPEYDQSEMFSATLRVNIRSKQEALQWLEDFQGTSLSDWRVRKCFPENTKFLIFKKGYRCSHNTQAQYKKGTVPHKKHTSCDAYLSITVKNYNMKRSSDKFLKTHPCVIELQHCHNHPTKACDVLRFRRPTQRVVEIFLDMYRKEHSPSSALSTHQYDIQIQHPENWFEILADGAECPNLQWCYYLYRKTFLKEYGPASGEGMLQSLTAAVKKYNEDAGSECAAVKKFEETDLLVVLCSPLMKRVHTLLKSSGEINFLDAGGSMDRDNSRIFTVLAPSVAGALPLGMIITSSESEDVLTEGMKMLQSIMPSDAFFGRGPTRGPLVMMTDDSKTERNTLTKCFPGIVLLLCFFHILQAFWTYVWDSKHNVKAEEKEEVYFIFKDWCYTRTEEDFLKHYHDILCNPLYSKNKFLVKHVKGLFLRAREWALCYRSELLIRGNNTNNYSEITIRQYKDLVMHRLKAYSVVQLFDFFTTRLESYFERRIAVVVNNRKENYYTSKHFIQPSKLRNLQCAESSHKQMFIVQNVEKGTKYTVDMELEICSCPVGFNGAPCKHQFAVAKMFNLSTSQFLPYDDKAAKAILHQIMTTSVPKPGWYASLKGGPVTSVTEAELGDQRSTVQEDDLPEDDIRDDITLIIDQQASSSGTSESTEHYTDEERERLLALWDSINVYITNGLKERPEVFGSAVEKFASQFNKAKALSENVVLSAMHTFPINSFGSKAMRKGKYIKVNTAACIRRKYAAMAGRKCTQQGRPPKAAFTKEHGYTVNRQIVPAWNRQRQRKGAIPHKLSVRVQYQASKQSQKK